MRIGSELLRIVLYFWFLSIYLTTKIGMYIMVLHAILILSNPKKYGISRILMRLLPGEEVKFNVKLTKL